LYSQNVEEGPIPTSFEYNLDKGITLEGETREEKGKVVMDKVFGAKIKFFKESAQFRQKIKVLNKDIV